jgi:hypothetical protein
MAGARARIRIGRRALIPAKRLDELVWQDLCALLREPAPLVAAVARAPGGAWLPQELPARRETLRRGQAHLRQQLERLTTHAVPSVEAAWQIVAWSKLR